VDVSPLMSGDIIHLASKEMRLVCGPPLTKPKSDLTRPKVAGRSDFIRQYDFIRHIIRRRSVRAVFQPIVNIKSRAIIGYEALGRIISDQLTSDTAKLFAIAEKCQLAAELSQAFRTAAIEDARAIAAGNLLFLNVHAAEMAQPGFCESLKATLRALPASCTVVLEVHEDAVLHLQSLREFRRQTSAMGWKLAYDDFGVGQSRLAEMAEVPPDFVKLDREIIHQLERSRGRQELVGGVRRFTEELGIVLIAEGLETEAEADICRRLGCELAQGFLLGRPRSVHTFASPGQTDELNLTAALQAARQMLTLDGAQKARLADNAS
jgi:EAL domain-containing protein (putative c-di-GMP-specific phosphodiesterase class I)